MTDLMNVFSPSWTLAESYGRIALELSKELGKLGSEVNKLGGNAPRDKIITPVFGGVLLGYPTNVRVYGPMAQYGPRVALTMFESTQLPPEWKEILNTLDAVIVPSNWLVEVFRDNGVKIPIHVCPVGVSRIFKPVKRPADRKPYTFLALGDRGDRKGWHTATRAFLKAFGDDTDYRLLIKVREQSLSRIRGFTNENIDMVRGEMSDRKLKKLYAETDCMLFPSCGEGQGLPPLEFAATGGPVIATHWGALAEHLPMWGLPIHYEMQPAWGNDPVLGGLGMWAKPDMDDLADTMRFVVKHHAYMLERGIEASKFVRRHYTWQKLAKTVYQVWLEARENYGERNLRHAV